MSNINDIVNEAAKNARKGTGPAQSPRDSGPAGLMKVGSAGPGGGSDKGRKAAVQSDSTSRGMVKVGSAGPNVKNRDAQAKQGGTTQKSTGKKK